MENYLSGSCCSWKVVVVNLQECNILLLIPTSGGGNCQPGTRQNFSDLHFIAFMNRSCQDDVVCITIYLNF